MWSGPVGLGAIRTRSVVIGSLYERVRECLLHFSPCYPSHRADPGRFSWHVHMRHPLRAGPQESLEILVARAKLTDSARFRSSWHANLSDVHLGRESERSGGTTERGRRRRIDVSGSIGYSRGFLLL